MTETALLQELLLNYRSYVAYVVDMADLSCSGPEALARLPDGALAAFVYFKTTTEPFSVVVWDSDQPTNPPDPEASVEAALDLGGAAETVMVVMLQSVRN